MTIRFITNQNPRSQILSVDPIRLAEIDDINESFFTLRLVFKIKLNPEDTSIEDFDRVVVSILPTQQEKQDSTLLVSTRLKKNENPKILNMIRNDPQGQIQTSFNDQALKRLNERLTATARVRQSDQEQNAITSVTTYIQPYIKKSKENLFEVYELDTPANVFNFENQRFLEFDRLDKDVVFKDVMINRLLPTQAFEKKSLDSLFKLKLLDYFNLDTQKPTSEFINSLVFYKPKKVLKSLKEIEILTKLKLPLRYLDSQLIAKFDLFVKNKEISDESTNITIELDRYAEAYYALNSDLVIQESKIDKENYISISSDNFNTIDKHKILGYNIYAKTIDNNGNISNFSFIASNTTLNDGLFELNLKNTDSTRPTVVRAVPLTALGESNVFSDVLIGDSSGVLFEKKLVCHLYQVGINNLKIDISNLVKDLDTIKIYRRDCTNSPNSDFQLLRSYRNVKTSSFVFVDSNVIPGHFYEFYIEVYDRLENKRQMSDYLLCEVKLISNSNDVVSISNLTVDGRAVTFSITSNSNENTNNLIERAIIETNQISTVTNQTTTQRLPSDYSPIYFHKVTRINTVNSSRHSFKIVSDGLFVDSPDTSRLENIEPITSGIEYIYQIETFKRDPVTILNNFYARGNSNNNEWFYRPFKWMNPFVKKRGMLFNENDQGEIKLQETELLTMDPVSVPQMLYVTVPTRGFDENLSINASNITRDTIKISWPQDDNKFDSFIVYKVVNGKKSYLGKTRTSYIYHKINNEDLGTIYYEVTPIMNNFMIEKTYFSNSVVVEDDTSKRLVSS